MRGIVLEHDAGGASAFVGAILDELHVTSHESGDILQFVDIDVRIRALGLDHLRCCGRAAQRIRSSGGIGVLPSRHAERILSGNACLDSPAPGFCTPGWTGRLKPDDLQRIHSLRCCGIFGRGVHLGRGAKGPWRRGISAGRRLLLCGNFVSGRHILLQNRTVNTRLHGDEVMRSND